MSNVKSINQDNVLGGDELSPSEFDAQHSDEVPVKKSSGLLTMVGGIGAAVIIVGFFGWKIVSPYFGHRSQDDVAAIAPIENAAPANQQQTTVVGSPVTSVEAPQSTAIAPQPIGTVMASQPAAANNLTVPQPVPVQTVPAAPQTAQQSPAAVNQPSQGKVLPHEVPAADGQESHVTTEDIVKINKRIDDISATLAALKDSIEKLKAAKPQAIGPQATKPVAKPTPVKPVVTSIPQKKPAQPDAASSTVMPAGDKANKSASTEQLPSGKPTEEYQLQAVLKGIAWFKTKSGETLTVGPGDELKGVGVVDQIDPDANRVTFTNGRVFR